MTTPGHETTVNLIGNWTLALLENTNQRNRLRDDPALIKTAVEELLRYNGPLETATERYAREDTAVAGVTVPRGELVLAVLASANRDEQQFEDADRLDLGRESNPHVAFGFGIQNSCCGVWSVYQSRLQEIPEEVQGEGCESCYSKFAVLVRYELD